MSRLLLNSAVVPLLELLMALEIAEPLALMTPLKIDVAADSNVESRA